MTETEQSAHAQLFREVSRQLMEAAFLFAAGVGPKLSRLDVGRMYLAIGTALTSAIVGRDGTIAMLRELADELEAGEQRGKPN